MKQKILELIEANPGISSKELSWQIPGSTPFRVSKVCGSLQKLGRIHSTRDPKASGRANLWHLVEVDK